MTAKNLLTKELKFSFYITFIPLFKVYNIIKYIENKYKGNNIIYTCTNSNINYTLKGTGTKLLTVKEEQIFAKKMYSTLEDVTTKFNVDLTYDTEINFSSLRNN